MTREHKLAVVLGFGLLLFVGILVSDHFSASQRRVSTALAARTPMRAARSADPVSIQPVVFDNPGSVTRVQPATGIAGAVPRGNGQQPAQMPGVPAELYTLKDGETLYKICQSRYGNGNLWKELAEFNKSIISNPTKLRKGMTIRIPSASVLRGEIQQVAAPPIPDAITPSPQSLPEMLATPSDAVPASEREYVVQKGDTLGAIASREMGSAKKWNQLYEANKDRIKGPTDLRIGQPLRIPADS